MVSEKLIQIVRRLLRLTQEGKLNWSEDPNSMSFTVSFPSYSLSISSEDDVFNPDNRSVFIKIYNSEGGLIEAVSDEEFPGDTFVKEQKTPYKVLYELHQNARRRAIGIDAALDSILSEFPEPDVPF
jgi:hypothetical protein